MCSSYWNLMAQVTCPCCGWQGEDTLQTHFRGDIGACVDYFHVEELIEYLEGWTGVMDGTHGDDDFCAVCPRCQTYWLLGARVGSGRVLQLWNLSDTDCPDSEESNDS